jgi:outer membrane protein OmpA-like peptidoglycan-associated protein/opacity protein-like surface antigen
MRSTVLGFVAALFLVAGPAYGGGGTRGDWEIGGYGGYGWLDGYDNLRPKDNFLYGGRLGYFISDHWSFEASGQRLSTKTRFEDPLLTNVDMHLDAFRGNLAYNFAEDSPVRPFLTAGGGYERFDTKGDNGESSDFGWNAGGGIRFFLTPNWQLRADGRFVQIRVGGERFAETEGNAEASLGLSYVFGGHEEVEEVAAPPNQPPTVTCASERAEILPGENVRLVATATDPEGDPLTYEWVTTTGHVTGAGNTATLDFTGATPPTSATVTVRVSDGHGNTATSDCSVRLIAPAPPPAQAVSCLAGGFPRNLSRLTNVDKACLDDVVQRLKTDPRARVIVIGHADSHERSADAVGQQRAAAVKGYLTQAGVEDARITIKSAGSTKPLDTGGDVAAQARNRRVEVWFVPEGATAPE